MFQPFKNQFFYFSKEVSKGVDEAEEAVEASKDETGSDTEASGFLLLSLQCLASKTVTYNYLQPTIIFFLRLKDACYNLSVYEVGEL